MLLKNKFENRFQTQIESTQIKPQKINTYVKTNSNKQSTQKKKHFLRNNFKTNVQKQHQTTT